MAERRRRSKWDVISEPEVAVKHTDFPIKADDSGKEGISNSEWDSSKGDTNSFLPSPEIKADSIMIMDESSEVPKLTASWEDGARFPNACSPKPHFPEPPDMDVDERDHLIHSDGKPLSDQTTGRHEDFNGTKETWNGTVEENYGIRPSPGRDVLRQQSPAVSPRGNWSRSYRYMI